MDPKSMEKAMLKNIVLKTGKSLEEWINIANKQKKTDKDTINFLKKEHSVGHFYAHLIVKNK
tara:strand:+ start:254 stop:439 length:186 start_codon:yes stop_codon:yes gene_type:complete